MAYKPPPPKAIIPMSEPVDTPITVRAGMPCPLLSPTSSPTSDPVVVKLLDCVELYAVDVELVKEVVDTGEEGIVPAWIVGSGTP